MSLGPGRALDRMERALSRRLRRSGRRTSFAPLWLGLALALGYAFLTILVPEIWRATLPGGIAGATALRGWPGLLRDVAVLLGHHPLRFFGGVAAVVVVGMVLARGSGALRWAFRLLALAAIGFDFAILALALRVAYVAGAAAAGIG